jgi:hypothetical protein
VPNLIRVRCTWGGAVPGGGISTFYADDAVIDDVSSLKTFFTSLAPLLPSELTITVPNVADTIDEASGRLTGSKPLTGGGVVAGSGNSAYSAGVGAFVNWFTAVVRNGRLLRGRTFIAPLGQGYASADGTLNDSIRTSIDTAALALVANATWLTYHRPPKGTFAGGLAGLITSAQTVDRVTALKTRRY